MTLDFSFSMPAIWAGSYLAGSIPAGLVFSRLLRGVDVRRKGSGNIGSANVFRVAGPGPAAATLAFDCVKGFVPVFIAQSLGLPLWALLVTGVFAVIGHNWSLFLRGRGGKGIATSVGVLAGIAPIVALIALAVWIVVIIGSRYASLASLLMMGSVPVMLAVFGYADPYVVFGGGLVVLAIYRHRTNIGRLWSGTELKINVSTAGRGG
ncbi:MAG: glycerol-3-phosphate 1-O-acyltransferase PlsY [Nitrolancea sp.]